MTSPNPESLETDTPDVPRNAAVPARPAEGASGLELWTHRLAVLLFVLLCATVGVTLVVLPWSLVWTDNYLLVRFPGLRPLATSGFVRGLCSGLGVLDLWIGFAEALNYHEETRVQK